MAQQLVENFFFYHRNYKEALSLKKLMKIISKVMEVSDKAQASEDVVQTGDDDIVTVVWPANIKLELIGENVADIFRSCDKVHISDEGKLFFHFAERGKLKTDKWLNEEDAMVWYQGLDAQDLLREEEILSSQPPSEDPRENLLEILTRDYDKAKALMG